MSYDRGVVVVGPDLFADNDRRPYVCLSDDSHPFSAEEALYATVTSTNRPAAIALTADDFEAGGLPRRSYVNPWTIASIRHADIESELGRLVDERNRNHIESGCRLLGSLTGDATAVSYRTILDGETASIEEATS